MAFAMADVACGRSGYEPIALRGDGGEVVPDGPLDASVFVAEDGGEDTFLSSTDPGLNFGGVEVLRTGAAPPATTLVRFDLGEIPAGATAQAVTLTVWTGAGTQDPSEVRIYRVFEDWAEGNDTGAAGEANWDLRAPGQAWFSAGCGAGSRDAAARAVFDVAEPSGRHDVAIPPAVVQAWIDDPASNRGLALIAASGAGIELVSSESADTARRPALAIEWSP